MLSTELAEQWNPFPLMPLLSSFDASDAFMLKCLLLVFVKLMLFSLFNSFGKLLISLGCETKRSQLLRCHKGSDCFWVLRMKSFQWEAFELVTKNELLNSSKRMKKFNGEHSKAYIVNTSFLVTDNRRLCRVCRIILLSFQLFRCNCNCRCTWTISCWVSYAI